MAQSWLHFEHLSSLLWQDCTICLSLVDGGMTAEGMSSRQARTLILRVWHLAQANRVRGVLAKDVGSSVSILSA
jgi:hypothetical protein